MYIQFANKIGLSMPFDKPKLYKKQFPPSNSKKKYIDHKPLVYMRVLVKIPFRHLVSLSSLHQMKTTWTNVVYIKIFV